MTRLEFVKRLEEEVKQYKLDLDELESGRTRHGQCRAGNYEWIDTTANEIAWYKDAIANHQGVISKLKSETF